MLLIALIVFQAVAASEPPEPIALKPPFVFHADSRILSGASANGFPPVPPSATRLLTETFGSGFNPSVGVTSTTTAWRVFIDTGSVNNAYWARVLPALSTVYGDTAWAPCGVCDGSGRDPDIDNYPPNTGTSLIYGPVDLRDYYAAEVTFNYLLDAPPTLDDSFFYGASDDGTNFTGVPESVLSPSSWQTRTLFLGDHVGKSSVYIVFHFRSNGDANVGRGAFVDNVSLRAAPYLKTYAPLINKNFAVATPTPQFRYNYTFDSGLGGDDPDFIAWGRAYSSGSNPVIYEQGGGPGRSGDGMYLYNTQLNLVSMAGPDATAPTNFEISADFFVNTGKDNARYGLIFSADSTTFRRNAVGEPRFDANTNYFKFALVFPAGSGNDTAADYKFERCAGDSANCIDVVGRTALPGGLGLAKGVWHTMTVRRQGAAITLLVNGTVIRTISDGNLIGDREFGMFIQSQNANGVPPDKPPLEVFFDNYRVTQLP